MASECPLLGGEEMVEELEAMMAERLTLWKSKREERMPKHIIVYHDGKRFFY